MKAKVLGFIKPETVVCLNGKNNICFVEDTSVMDKNGTPIKDPEIGNTCYFDEWFWKGDIRRLKEVLSDEILIDK